MHLTHVPHFRTVMINFLFSYKRPTFAWGIWDEILKGIVQQDDIDTLWLSYFGRSAFRNSELGLELEQGFKCAWRFV